MEYIKINPIEELLIGISIVHGKDYANFIRYNLIFPWIEIHKLDCVEWDNIESNI